MVPALLLDIFVDFVGMRQILVFQVFKSLHALNISPKMRHASRGRKCVRLFALSLRLVHDDESGPRLSVKSSSAAAVLAS